MVEIGFGPDQRPSTVCSNNTCFLGLGGTNDCTSMTPSWLRVAGPKHHVTGLLLRKGWKCGLFKFKKIGFLYLKYYNHQTNIIQSECKIDLISFGLSNT